MESMQERMDANQAELNSAIAHMKWEEPTSVDMEPEVAREEVPREHAAIMPVGEPRKRRRDRNLAAKCRQQQQQKRPQSKDGCRKNLVAAHRGTTRRAEVA
jgi:hypothetical protein